MELYGIKVVFSSVITFGQAQGLCPLCHERMEKHQETRLATSDGYLNPDIYVHNECIKKEKSRKDAFALVVDDWRRAKEYIHWFRR